MEVAEICGLELVPRDQRNPYLTSSTGVGQAMRICYDDFNVKKFVIGSGGSAFSDGGFGAVRALKIFDFLDENGTVIEPSSDFSFD